MTVFDYVVIGIVAVSLALGVWRGVMGEIIALVAWVLAFIAALGFGVQVGLSCSPASPTRRSGRWRCGRYSCRAGCMALLRLAVRGMVKALG